MYETITRESCAAVQIASVLVNILAMGYVLKNDVMILFRDHLVLDDAVRDNIDYGEINSEISCIRDEAMAVRLAEAYLGDRLNYKEEYEPEFTTTVSFDEKKYEYLVKITVKLQAGDYTDTEDQYVVGLRKDYGMVTYYD